MLNKDNWYQKWFNEDYLKLYSYHDQKEAKEQVDFILNHVSLDVKSRILDLGCGFGRHVIALAEKGVHTVGVDLSLVLLQRAKQKAKEKHLLKKATFIQADMLNLPDIGPFDLVTSFFTSFGYFEKEEQNQQVLKQVFKVLKKGGFFFFDYLHPDQVKRDLKAFEQKYVDGDKVVIRKTIEKDFVIKTIDFPKKKYMERVKLYSKKELINMLKEVGFEPVYVWNDYKGNRWKEKGDRQIFLVKKVG